VVDNIWLKEIMGAKLEFLEAIGFICEFSGALLVWKCNLEQIEVLN
jgi:hypothetical protein